MSSILNNKKVNVIGLGYIGLPTASLLATKGCDVLGVDVNQKIVDIINNAEIHIAEPGLDILVKSAVNSKKLRASTVPEVADVFIIAVPTPFDANKAPVLTYVEDATRAISKVLKEGDLVILESTSPVGATEQVKEIILGVRADLKNIYIAHCPERVIPGRVLQELVENDRIVGGVDSLSTDKAAEFYQAFVEGEVLKTDAKTAEMCKLVENSFRDVNIAFANELSLICERLSINVWELIRLANRHPRVNILQPGPGVGGHCIAVDPWFIVSSAPEQSKLIKQAREINDYKPQWVIERVKIAARRFTHPVIACLGLAFKANIDDLRESPALMIAETLNEQQIGKVLAYEPNIAECSSLKLSSLHDAISQADIVVVLVDHDEIKALDHSIFAKKLVIDTRGIL